MAPRWFRLSVALAIVATACECGDPMPPDDTFDGNVIIGDGTIPDVESDAETDGGDPDTSLDAGSDASDADAITDAGDRCTEPAVAVLTASAAVSELDTWEGMIVEITGTATRTGISCTELVCPPEMQCCNTCTASVAIEGRIVLSGGECFAPPPGCSGSNCPGTLTCRPAVIGVPQVFKGTLLDRGPDGVALELFSVSN